MNGPLQPHNSIYRFGLFVLDTGRGALLTANGAEIPLRAKSFGLLCLMVENAGLLLTRDRIMGAVWPNLYVTDDNITQCIHEIRDALGRDARDLLQTVRRRGYIFNAAAVRSGCGVQDATVGERAPWPDAASCGGPGINDAAPLSVLVLPLRSRHGFDAHERFAAYITAYIVTDLVRHLRIVAPGDAQVLFRDERSANQPAAPGECQAAYLLRGTVQGIRHASISLQLIHCASDICIWADRFEPGGPSGRIAFLMREISLTLLRDVERRLDAVPAQGLTAQALSLRGHAWMLRPASIARRREALRCFEQALAVERESLGARLGIVMTLVANLTNGWSPAIERDEARAETLLRDIFESGTDAALAHTINGILLRLQGDLTRSKAELEIAMDLAPHRAMAASQFGMTLLYCGEPDAALRYFEKGVRVGHGDPQMPMLLTNLGTGRLLAGDVNAALEPLQEATMRFPEHSSVPLALAAAFGLKLQSAAAGAALRRAVDLCPTLGILSRLRNWVSRQGGPEFMSVYQHTMECGLQEARMPDV